jgi:hypothetical protein
MFESEISEDVGHYIKTAHDLLNDLSSPLSSIRLEAEKNYNIIVSAWQDSHTTTMPNLITTRPESLILCDVRMGVLSFVFLCCTEYDKTSGGVNILSALLLRQVLPSIWLKISAEVFIFFKFGLI